MAASVIQVTRSVTGDADFLVSIHRWHLVHDSCIITLAIDIYLELCIKLVQLVISLLCQLNFLSQL